MTDIRQIAAIAKRELSLEIRSRGRWAVLFFFAFAVLLMVAFAAPSTSVLRANAGGVLWIGLLLASTRSLDQSYAIEMEDGALEGMILWPVRPWSLYYGKALSNTLTLLAVAFALLPLVIGICDAQVRGSFQDVILFTTLGCAGLAAPGTLYGLITAKARGSSVLLPLLYFPLVVPVILSAARGTTLVFEGDPMAQSGSWLGLLWAFNALHWSLSGLLYGRIAEDA